MGVRVERGGESLNGLISPMLQLLVMAFLMFVQLNVVILRSSIDTINLQTRVTPSNSFKYSPPNLLDETS